MDFNDFIDACANGNLEYVRLYMSKQDPSYDNNLAMTFAINNYRVEVMKLLLTDERVRNKVNSDVMRLALHNHIPKVFMMLWPYYHTDKDRIFDLFDILIYPSALKFILKDKKLKVSRYMLDTAIDLQSPYKTIKILVNDKRTANVTKESFITACADNDPRILKLLLKIFDPSDNALRYLRAASDSPNNIAVLIADERIRDKLDDYAYDNYAKFAWSNFYNKIVDKYFITDIEMAVKLNLVDPSAFNNWALRFVYSYMKEDSRFNESGWDTIKILLSNKKVLAKLRDCTGSADPLFDVVKDIPKQIDKLSNPMPLGPDPTFNIGDNPTSTGYRRGVDGHIYLFSGFLVPSWYYNVTDTPLSIYFGHYGPLKYRRTPLEKPLDILLGDPNIGVHYENWLKGINIYNTNETSYTYYSYDIDKKVHIDDIYKQKRAEKKAPYEKAQFTDKDTNEFTDKERDEFAKLGLPWSLDEVNNLRKLCEKSHIKSCYTILQVPSGTSLVDISKEFRKLSLKWHPDKPKGNKLYYQAITSAYGQLKDILG